MTWWEYLAVAVSGVAAGAINAVAGGGTLVSFPTLISLGVPPVSANVTNTVALVPGYLGGAFAQRRDLVAYLDRLRALAVIAAAGGLAGSILLVTLPEDLFANLVPVLIVSACALLAFQEVIKRRVQASRRTAASVEAAGEIDGIGDVASRGKLLLALLVAPAAVYGGYFGAGLGIMLLALLGIALDDPLPRINSLKSALSLVINLVAAAFFVFSDHVLWDAAAVLAVSSVLGGVAGGHLAGRLRPSIMRTIAITVGLVVAVGSVI